MTTGMIGLSYADISERSSPMLKGSVLRQGVWAEEVAELLLTKFNPAVGAH